MRQFFIVKRRHIFLDKNVQINIFFFSKQTFSTIFKIGKECKINEYFSKSEKKKETKPVKTNKNPNTM